RLVALVHHPLALESGLSVADAACLRASERSALVCTRHIIATSATIARLLVADYGVASGRLSVLHPGTGRVSAALRNRDCVVNLLAVGSVIPGEGYDVRVAALARLRHLPWRLVIAGDCGRNPQTSRRLRDEIARLGLTDRISLLGAVASEQMSPLYASA